MNIKNNKAVKRMGSVNVKRSKSQRVALAEKICEKYETGHYTIESCCKAFKVNPNTFRNWAAPNIDSFEEMPLIRQNELIKRGFVHEVHEMYKKAKECSLISFKELLLDRSRCGLLELVSGKNYTIKRTISKKDIDGKVISTREYVLEKYLPPNISAIIFALKALDRESFAGQIAIETKTGDEFGARLAAMAIDELEEEIKRLAALAASNK